jgi:hypothetical protein
VHTTCEDARAVDSVSALNAVRWAELSHAYGFATDLQPRLEQLFSYPSERHASSEPWHSLWSCLCHQGDVYSASFAAVPVIVEALEANPLEATRSYFQLPVCIELARLSHHADVPNHLAGAYFAALGKFPVLVAQAAAKSWDPDFAAVAVASIAIAKGNPALAQLLMELEDRDIPEVLEWYRNR